MQALLVEDYRGDILECEHWGHICGVTDRGEIKYAVGDINFLSYLRSSAKTVQAIPLIKRGIEKKCQFTEKEIVVLVASHRAQSMHVEALEGIMKKVGIEERELICLPTYPLNNESKENLLRKNMPKRRIYHNCSGKHFNIITLCKALGYPSDNYWDISNQVQQEIVEHISILSDYPKNEIKIGVDGCGVPVFALPLKNLANIYFKLACPDIIEDSKIRNAVIKITKLMNKHHDMVSGSNLICSLLNQDENIVAKGGAKGVYCFGLKRERLGFAIKVMDGSEESWPFIVAKILEDIHYDNKETIDRLYKAFPKSIKNDNNKIVGCSKVAFDLKLIK
ncbi:asparaginase [Mycoplasmatota bacterium]|nr:asparaginase [Mycoplasmatota bacterium]